MKTPFTLEAWLKDTSQKVVDENGRPVRIICTDADGLYPIIGLVDNKTPLPCGKDGRPPYIGGGGGSLFLVTPEPELSEFEKKLESFYNHHLQVCTYDNQGTVEDSLHDGASKLLSLAIDARAKELSEALEKSKLDKDSIPYHLIEFMCNLYTCRNWKEIEQTAELYVTRLKAAAMKDLPRWKKAYKTCYVGDSIVIDEYGYYRSKTVKQGSHYILISDIEKLPGFNE